MEIIDGEERPCATGYDLLIVKDANVQLPEHLEFAAEHGLFPLFTLDELLNTAVEHLFLVYSLKFEKEFGEINVIEKFPWE